MKGVGVMGKFFRPIQGTRVYDRKYFEILIGLFTAVSLFICFAMSQWFKNDDKTVCIAVAAIYLICGVMVFANAKKTEYTIIGMALIIASAGLVINVFIKKPFEFIDKAIAAIVVFSVVSYLLTCVFKIKILFYWIIYSLCWATILVLWFNFALYWILILAVICFADIVIWSRSSKSYPIIKNVLNSGLSLFTVSLIAYFILNLGLSIL